MIFWYVQKKYIFEKKFTVKKYFLAALIILFYVGSFAQVKGKSTRTKKTATHKKAAVAKTPAKPIPDFKFFKVPDSTSFTKDSLQKDKTTILMFFNADCGHCVVFIKDMLMKDSMNLLQNTQIVMGAPNEHKVLNKFYEDYKMADYPNITLCRDANYFLVTQFDLREYPGVYIFDKNGRFVKGLSNMVTVKQVAAAIK